MDRLIGEFHLFTREGRGAFSNLGRQLSHARGFFQRKHRTGGKTPGAVIENADPKPSVLRVAYGSDAAIFATNGLARAVEEPDIAVLSPGSNNAFQREFGKFVPIGSAHRVTAFVRCERVSNAVSITGSWGSSQRIRKEVTHLDLLEHFCDPGAKFASEDRRGFFDVRVFLQYVARPCVFW